MKFFCSLLTVAFIVLKLTGFVAWGWFWVLSPLIFFALLFIIAVIVSAFETPQDRLRRALKERGYL